MISGSKSGNTNLDSLPFIQTPQNAEKMGRPAGFVCDVPLIGSLAKVRYHRLEVRVFFLLALDFVEQRLAVKHQTVF